MPITIDGLDELSERLQNLPAKAAKRYLTNVAKTAGQVVVAEMQSTAPMESGRLEGNICQVASFTNEGGGTTMLLEIGPALSTFYGMFHEFGTRFQPALHWMQRAWEACQDRVLDVFATEATGLLMDLENREK